MSEIFSLSVMFFFPDKIAILFALADDCTDLTVITFVLTVFLPPLSLFVITAHIFAVPVFFACITALSAFDLFTDTETISGFELNHDTE